MQIERFLAVLTEVYNELNSPIITNSINELIALIPQASQLTQFETHLKALENHFTSCVVNSYPPSKLKIINSINGANLCGINALNEITQIVQSSKLYNPADKAAELAKFNKKITEFKTKISTEINSLTSLGIKPFSLDKDKFEVGVILSEQVTKNEIKKIQEYLNEWHRLLRYLNEITTGNHENPKISTLGTTDSLEIYFENTIETASCVAIAIDKIASVYQKVREGKQMLEDMKDKGFISLDVDKNFNKQKHKMIDDGLNSLVEEITQKYKGKNNPERIHELKIGLRHSFEFIANSIDSGIDVEVNAPNNIEPLVQILDGESDDVKNTKAEKNKIIKERNQTLLFITEAGSKTKFLPIERTERILGLPEPDLSVLGVSDKNKPVK